METDEIVLLLIVFAAFLVLAVNLLPYLLIGILILFVAASL